MPDHDAPAKGPLDEVEEAARAAVGGGSKLFSEALREIGALFGAPAEGAGSNGSPAVGVADAAAAFETLNGGKQASNE